MFERRENLTMEDDTIELIDYLRVIWKRKRLIIIGALFCMAAAGVVSFMLPRVYKVYSIVEIGTVNMGNDIKPIEAPKDTKTKIEMAYSFKAMEGLNIPEGEFPAIEVKNPKDTRIIEVSTYTEDIKQALNVLKKLNIFLLDDHKRLVEESKTTLINDIKVLTLKTVTVKGEKNSLKQKLSLLRENRKNIKEQIKNVENRLEELLSEKKRLNLNANADNTLSMLVFTNEIQNNQRYYNNLQDRLKFEIANREVDIETKLNKKEEELETLELKKQNLKAKLDNMKETTVIKNPGYLEIPVKPKKRLNVLIAGMIGLMVSLFTAFFMEYLERVREREQGVSAP